MNLQDSTAINQENVSRREDSVFKEDFYQGQDNLEKLLHGRDDVLARPERTDENMRGKSEGRIKPIACPASLEGAILPRYSEQDLFKNLQYPQLAREQGIEGTVYLKLCIDQNGKVVDIEILRSTNALFYRAAIDAVWDTSFEPATLNNTPIAMSLVVQVRFKISDN